MNWWLFVIPTPICGSFQTLRWVVHDCRRRCWMCAFWNVATLPLPSGRRSSRCSKVWSTGDEMNDGGMSEYLWVVDVQTSFATGYYIKRYYFKTSSFLTMTWKNDSLIGRLDAGFIRWEADKILAEPSICPGFLCWCFVEHPGWTLEEPWKNGEAISSNHAAMSVMTVAARFSRVEVPFNGLDTLPRMLRTCFMQEAVSSCTAEQPSVTLLVKLLWEIEPWWGLTVKFASVACMNAKCWIGFALTNLKICLLQAFASTWTSLF